MIVAQINYVTVLMQHFTALNGTKGTYENNKIRFNWPNPDSTEKTPIKGSFNDKDIIITLPKTVTDPYRVKWFSVWCEDLHRSCADLVLNSIDSDYNACVKDFRIVDEAAEVSE